MRIVTVEERPVRDIYTVFLRSVPIGAIPAVLRVILSGKHLASWLCSRTGIGGRLFKPEDPIRHFKFSVESDFVGRLIHNYRVITGGRT